MVGFWSNMRWIDRGSARPPRACRPYLRTASPTLISASASASVVAGPCGKRRQIEGRRLQSPVIGLADLAQRLCGPGREAILAGPDGLTGMLGIERHKSGTVVPIAGVAAGRCCRQSLTHQRHDGIDLAGGLGGLSRCGRHAGRGRGRPVDFRRRERVGCRRATRIEIARRGRRCRRGLAPCRSGKAAQHQHGKCDREKWPADHHNPLAALRGRSTANFVDMVVGCLPSAPVQSLGFV